MTENPRGMFFEDFEVGMTLTTPARTVTSTDIVNFACLTVLSKRETSTPGRGIVTLRREIRNQRGELVQEMETTLLYRCRNGG